MYHWGKVGVEGRIKNEKYSGKVTLFLAVDNYGEKFGIFFNEICTSS
jgi:hypothetical protein